jgi:hypothetical protein
MGTRRLFGSVKFKDETHMATLKDSYFKEKK